MNNSNGDFSISITISLELVNPENNDTHPGTVESYLDGSRFNCILQSVLFHFEIPFKE